jgi:hypothetical protein
MDILEKIFGSDTKVRLMRLFIFNPETGFDLHDIVERTHSNANAVRREIKILGDIELIKNRLIVKEEVRKKGEKEIVVKKRSNGWILNSKFTYLNPLEDFLVYMNPFRHHELVERVRKIGNVKLCIISGVFIKEYDTRLDLFLVGDNFKKNVLENVVRSLESELGKELRYAALDTEDFQYRMNMCDKLISDVLDYPHEKVVNKLGIE